MGVLKQPEGFPLGETCKYRSDALSETHTHTHAHRKQIRKGKHCMSSRQDRRSPGLAGELQVDLVLFYTDSILIQHCLGHSHFTIIRLKKADPQISHIKVCLQVLWCTTAYVNIVVQSLLWLSLINCLVIQQNQRYRHFTKSPFYCFCHMQQHFTRPVNTL